MAATDAVIVGAGPAGSWAAYRLAQAGARVTLVDGSHPREKPCGGGLTERAVHMLLGTIDVAAMPSVPVDRASFMAGDRRAEISLRSPQGASAAPLTVVARRDFDRALLDAAVRAGAAHVPARATDIARDGSGWRVSTAGGTVRGRWLLGADGANSLVRRRVAAPFPRSEISITAGYFARAPATSRIDVAFEARPAGYLWAFPRTDHVAVGICAQADEASPAALMPLVDRWMARHMPGSPSARQRYGWPVPSLTIAGLQRERPAGAGWMLLGDAAGLVDPITREGIFFALVSAAAAAQSLMAEAAPEARYHERLRDTVFDELLRAARLKSWFFQPHFTGLLVNALQRSRRVRGIMGDLVAGHQTYRGLRRRLLGTLELRLMYELWRA